jgi:hypothetical protein
MSRHWYLFSQLVGWGVAVGRVSTATSFSGDFMLRDEEEIKPITTEIIEKLVSFTKPQREEIFHIIFSYMCKHCYRWLEVNEKCHCWNDE